jgi:hypothetical protein
MRKIILSILILSICCQNKDGNTLLEWFANTSVVDDWQRMEVQKFRGDELYKIINGGATLYLDHGLSHGIRVQYGTTDGKENEVFYYVLKDTASAQKLFTVIQENLSRIEVIDGYDAEKIKVSKTIGATLIFGWKGRCFFELNVSGFNNYEDAISKGKPFLARFRILCK